MAQNWWEQDAPVKPVARQGGPVPIIQDNSKAAAEARAAQAAEIAAQANARAAAEAARDEAKFKAEGAAGKPTEAQQKAATLVSRIAGGFQDIESVLSRNPSAQSAGAVETVRGGLPASGIFSPLGRSIAGADRRIVSDAQGDMLDALLTLGTGAAYSPEQLDAQKAGYFPQYGDTDEEIAVKNNRLRRMIEAAKENAGPLAPKIDSILQKYDPTAIAGYSDAQQMQISGGERYSTDTDKAIAAAVSAAFAQGGTVEDLTRAAQEAGGMVGPDDVAKFKAAVDARAKGRQVSFVPSQTGVRNPISQAVGQALMTPAGTALTGAVNAAGLGALSLAAGDQVKGLEALNPNAGAIGEVIGGGIGAAGVGKAGAAVAGKIAPSLMGGGIAGTVGREVAQDVAAGGLTAINTGNNLTESVLTSALGSVGGQALGAGARKLLPTAKNMLGMDVPPSGGIPPSGGPDMPSGGGSGGVTPSGGAPDLGAVDDTFIPTRTTFNDGGASGTNIETIRATRAAELPVPVELAKFQRTRLFADQQKARELAKNNEVGGPIRERLAQQQEAFRQNFDRFIDSTGSEIEGDLLGKGAVVDEALRKLANVQKTRTRILYKRAEKAGETSEPVPYGDVKAFIEDQDVTTREKLAPVLDAVANQLRKNDPDGTGQIPINAMENIRKLINKVAKPGTPDETFGRDLKGLIDSATEGKGGDLYQQARAARMKYADTFENTALVKSLIGTKPGTVDRAVALEKVAEKAIYSPATSLADIKALKGVLDQASTRGQRAWQELQGATIENIREKALTRQSDESGKLVVSPAGLQKAIEQLDKSGKLDYVFDFNTAKLLRTMSEVVNDAATAPVGSVNSSGTSAALANMFDLIGGAATGGKSIALKEVFKFAKNRELRKEVKRLLD